jgi:hypothetical protein
MAGKSTSWRAIRIVYVYIFIPGFNKVVKNMSNFPVDIRVMPPDKGDGWCLLRIIVAVVIVVIIFCLIVS